MEQKKEKINNSQLKGNKTEAATKSQIIEIDNILSWLIFYVLFKLLSASWRSGTAQELQYRKPLHLKTQQCFLPKPCHTSTCGSPAAVSLAMVLFSAVVFVYVTFSFQQVKGPFRLFCCVRPCKQAASASSKPISRSLPSARKGLTVLSSTRRCYYTPLLTSCSLFSIVSVSVWRHVF